MQFAATTRLNVCGVLGQLPHSVVPCGQAGYNDGLTCDLLL